MREGTEQDLVQRLRHAAYKLGNWSRTILRAEPEQVSGDVLLYEQAANEIEQLRARLAEVEGVAAVRQMCEWHPDSDDYNDTYSTGCGKAWAFSEGDLAENGVRFCPFCGGFIREAARAAGGEG
jgi:hypothetical protein